MTIHTGPSATPFDHLDDQTKDFYLKSLDILDDAGVRYVIGGAYALSYHAGVVRHTKDLDAFLKEQDVERALRAFEKAGYRIERTHPHWLAKAHADPAEADAFIDLIYASGNGISRVDDEWLDNAVDGDLFGRPVRISPAEEIVWSKSFVQERHRFDGADINHLLLARAESLDWHRLLRRFASHYPVLLAHLTLFVYVFPCEKPRVPDWVFDTLFDRMRKEPLGDRVCRGTLLSWEQYLPDLHEHDLQDARVVPHGNMTAEEVRRWTAAEK
jgi:hypothetical protein